MTRSTAPDAGPVPRKWATCAQQTGVGDDPDGSFARQQIAPFQRQAEQSARQRRKRRIGVVGRLQHNRRR